MPAKTLMIQGTSSSAGKSFLVAGLCRLFMSHGIRVAPFKAQNMSNNAAICADGSEIGRAQALQALASGLEPVAEMNPILMKPEGNNRSQIILKGRLFTSLSALSYYERKKHFWTTVTESLDALRSQYDLILIEGAGSPVELNLKQGDIVNMAIARYANSPVLLVGDIDRGGIFAQLLGTLWLLEDEERDLVRGLIVNKFRGDINLFTDGVKIIEKRSNIPVLGVIPYLENLSLPEEDAVALDNQDKINNTENKIDIVIIRLPLISNFDDFDALANEPGVCIRYISTVDELGNPDAVIIPGTKSTISDLNWLRENGLANAIVFLANRGKSIVGICGGYQMLGVSIEDPDKIESSFSSLSGLNLLPHRTIFQNTKETHQITAKVTSNTGWLADLHDKTLLGYEIHIGKSIGSNSWLKEIRRDQQDNKILDGTIDMSGRIWGCYMHGIFNNTCFRHAWLRHLGWAGTDNGKKIISLDDTLNNLAATLEKSLDILEIERILDI